MIVVFLYSLSILFKCTGRVVHVMSWLHGCVTSSEFSHAMSCKTPGASPELQSFLKVKGDLS